MESRFVATDLHKPEVLTPELLAFEQISVNDDSYFVMGAVHAFRGEQPDSPALQDAGALRGDTPLSITERSEV